MSSTTAFFVVFIGGLLIGLTTALVVRKNGYSFKRYFVTGFIMGAGILGIIVKIILDYL